LVERMTEILSAGTGFAPPDLATFDSLEGFPGPIEAEVSLLFLPPSPERGYHALQTLRRLFPGPVLVVGGAKEPKVILRSLQIGADLYLDDSELEAEFEAALRRLQRRADAGGPTGRVFGVIAASGGSGVSTLAANLAAALAQEREKCLLIDLNPGRGDLATLLDLKPQFSILDVCLNEARLDQAMFDKMLVRHSSGIYLLGAPPALEDSRALTSQGVKHGLAICRTLFGDTVVDLEDCFHAEQVEALAQTTTVLVVCRLDFTSLRNTKRLLGQLGGLGVDRERVKLVVNQFGLPNELPLDEVEQALGGKVAALIPHDPRTINAANNTGVPAVLKDPGSKVARSILQLAKPEQATRVKRSGLVPNLKHLFKDLLPARE
jgi:pilus assembly protein CpaE